MERSKHCKDLARDILSLYCKTHVKGIEDIFLKLSQAYDNRVLQWLLHTRINSGRLKNPEVYSALVFLSGFRQEHPEATNYSEVAKIFTGSKTAKHLPSIISFASFLSDPEVNSLLLPFQDVITICSSFKISGAGTSPMDGVKEDLKYIKSSFEQHLQMDDEPAKEVTPQKFTVKQKKQNMFRSLYREFSNEIADAADRSGLKEFASQLRAGILAQPPALSKHISVSIEAPKINESLRILKYVINKYDESKVSENHSFIMERAMLFSGNISRSDLMELYKKRELNRDFSKYLSPLSPSSEPVDSKPQLERLNVTDIQMLNPQYVSLLSAFFLIFRSKVEN